MTWPISGERLASVIGATLDPAARGASPTSALAGRERRAIPGDVFFAVHPGLHGLVAASLHEGAELAVVPADWLASSALPPDLRARCLAVANPLAAFRALAAAMRRAFPFPVIAVGGSNGKTTTKDMIAAVLTAGGRTVSKTPGSNNGWLGTPLSLCDPRHREGRCPDALVLEIGIDEVGAMADHVRVAAPDLAVLTALGPEHLSGLGDTEGAVREELELFRAPRRVWFLDDPRLAAHAGDVREGDVVVHDQAWTPDVPCPRVRHAWEPAGPAAGTLRLVFEHATRGRVEIAVPVPLPGRHNGTNAALAFAAGFALDRDIEEMRAAFRTFEPPPRRSRVTWLERGGALIDDSYNASPASMTAALAVIRAFPHRTKVLVLGDMLDLGAATEALHRVLAGEIALLREDLERVGDAVQIRCLGDAMRSVADALAASGAAVRWAPVIGDLSWLLDPPGLDDAVVLVKGSHGMHMDRVVAAVQDLGRDRRDPTTPAVAVLGAGALAIAREVRTRLGDRVPVRAPPPDALGAGLAHRLPFSYAIFSGLAPATVDPERELALMAQVVVNLRPGGAAILLANDPASDLLAEVAAPSVRIVRVEEPAALAAAVDHCISRSLQS